MLHVFVFITTVTCQSTHTHTYINIPVVKVVGENTPSKPYLLPVLCLIKRFKYGFCRVLLGHYFSSSLSLLHSFTPHREMQKLFRVVLIQGCFKFIPPSNCIPLPLNLQLLYQTFQTKLLLCKHNKHM